MPACRQTGSVSGHKLYVRTYPALLGLIAGLIAPKGRGYFADVFDIVDVKDHNLRRSSPCLSADRRKLSAH